MKVVCIDNWGFDKVLKLGQVYDPLTFNEKDTGCYSIKIGKTIYEFGKARFRPATPLEIVKSRLC